MSNACQQMLQLATNAASHCYQRQLEFLVDAKRLSSELRDDIVQLYLEISRLGHLDPSPDIDAVVIDNINSTAAIIETAANQDELSDLIQKLHTELAAISPSERSIDPLMTENLLNRRMIDLMAQLKQKLRFTARRHNDSGGHYDKDAYVGLRNQIYLSRRVYIEQLDHDLVQATNEDCARVEQVLYPDIVNSTADVFVDTVSALRDFLSDKVASPL